MSIEHDLRRALARRPAPEGLADRVLARVAAASGTGDRVGGSSDGGDRQRFQAPSGSSDARRRGRRSVTAGIATRWLAAAAAAAIAITGAAQHYVQQRTAAEAERVKQEIALALQITTETLALVQRRIDASAPDRQVTP